MMRTPARLPPTAGSVLANFVWMSLCFSLNHGCVTSCLALASSQLGPALGGYSSAVLYLCYTATALLIAPDIVRRLGAKGSLDWGLLLYCLYVGSYAVALLFPAFRWPSVIIGAALGGIAAGWLWTAQGGYFAAAAELYAHVLQLETEVTTSFLSGVFATLYLGLELALKLVSSYVLSRHGERSASEQASLHLFAIYTAIAVLSAVGMFFVRQIPPHPRDDDEGTRDDGDPAAAAGAPAQRSSRERSGARPDEKAPPKLLLAINLLRTDRKIILLAPINISFGFMASLMNFYVNGILVTQTLGPASIGLLTSVVSGVATVASLPLSWLAARAGKSVVILLGATVFLGEVLVLLAFAPAQLGRWSVLLPLYAAHGLGRSVWEGPNRALTADFFSANREGAFANMIMQNGLASTVGYFAFPLISPTAMAAVCAASLALSIPGFLAAAARHAKERKAAGSAALEEPFLANESPATVERNFSTAADASGSDARSSET